MSARKVAAEDTHICEAILNEMGIKSYDAAVVDCLAQYLKSMLQLKIFNLI